MSRIIIIGDIHGRSIWKEIVQKEQDANKFIFVGDYFDSFDLSTETQINNFLDIIEFKKFNEAKIPVELLIGNHDLHYITGDTGTSGYQMIGSFQICPTINKHLHHLKACHKEDNLLFTHAGVTETFLKDNGYEEGESIGEFLNELFKYRPRRFVFRSGGDPYGNDIYQSPMWVRPRSLMKDSKNLKKQGIVQIVGHTVQNKIDIKGKATGSKFFFIDTLGTSKEYLIIEDGVVKLGKI